MCACMCVCSCLYIFQTFYQHKSIQTTKTQITSKAKIKKEKEERERRKKRQSNTHKLPHILEEPLQKWGGGREREQKEGDNSFYSAQSLGITLNNTIQERKLIQKLTKHRT